MKLGGAYELYVLSMPESEREELTKNLQAQITTCKSKLDRLRIELVLAELQSIWNGNEESTN